MNINRKITLVTSMLLVICVPALGQRAKGTNARRLDQTQSREGDIRRLLVASGVINRELATIEPLFESYKRLVPQVPPKVWDEIEKEFRAEINVKAITELYMPIYEKHFSALEVRQLLAFYESPTGQKLLTESPLIQMEAFAAGARLGLSLGEKIQKMLKARGYSVPVA